MYVRTGKEDEAQGLCQQVKKTVPTDQPTLLALTMAYQELGQRKLILEGKIKDIGIKTRIYTYRLGRCGAL